jgi:hypothetical protein
MNDVDDPFLSISQIVALLPPGRGTSRVHPSAVIRWIRAGVRGPGGQHVKLRAVRCGSRWILKRSWLDAFQAALTPETDESEFGPAPRTPSARQRAAERAGRELEKLGI